MLLLAGIRPRVDTNDEETAAVRAMFDLAEPADAGSATYDIIFWLGVVLVVFAVFLLAVRAGIVLRK